ncbi:hypothetical protein ACFL06_01105 [Patescibacteria group bacterium]
MLRLQRKKIDKKGFTILEVTIAISVILIGISSTIILITTVINKMTVLPSQLVATYLAQEGIEIIRNARDTNWLEGLEGGIDWQTGITLDCMSGCEADYTNTDSAIPSFDPFTTPGRNLYIENIDGTDVGDGFYKYIDFPDANDIKTPFIRKITVLSSADLDLPPLEQENSMLIIVEVSWIEKGGYYKYTAQEMLYNWR